ncbi:MULTISPECIES: phenylalanine--tRNA ligase subunit beta [unclassified Actinobaculum]|uniref:phenylalanine--tRNA ligase subunit beta n=1 Tax=unclassified Actinobaculum TaxID=2609299 RepID=UPI000D525BAB|nr:MULTISPECIES: phenylalanine--tRNA ligase subunit beta [unclassified Actinobaculum]AWE42331.1 phenylalanine--tRNA ligase subunit beta [Actinobaculum sp. 313]RTE50903.1 phenylalanine--tRNA ligase subunit beta [Actinobaculum sp. 352]
MPLIPIGWLGAHVELPEDLTPQQLAASLVRVGLEEEAIHPAEVTGPVVVGRVLTRQAKEQSNGKVINYCRVDVGVHNDSPGTGKEPSELPSRGIICGAHNFDAGDYVVVSLPGAVLPGGFKISARKTYGHISDGMICSARELGIGEDHAGIIVLAKADDAAAIAALPEPGSDALPLLGVAGETLEINITPDRGYCFSMRGVAREYHHATGAVFTDPGLAENLPTPLPAANPDGFPVVVEDDAPIHGRPGCDRFVTRVVRGVDPQAQSPKWMRDRLTQAGMRPISLIVDATNYVMLDLGQPLHAYDLDTVVGPLVVRRARDDEHLVTLDDVDRALDPEDLLITDCSGGHGARVLGLAGTMGGADTEIASATTNVLIEAAHFDAVSVARTARRHKLPSEASKRFEREVDPLVAPVAAQAVVDILVQYGGGVAGTEVTDYCEITLPEVIEFPLSEVERLTGLRVDAERIVTILADIGCTVAAGASPGVVTVTPPSWRPDLVAPADYVEEVARIIGYDNIDSLLPQAVVGRGLTTKQRQRRDIMRALAEQGWVQSLSYPFISTASIDKQGISEDDTRRLAIRLKNPLQEEAPYMRTSLLDSLLDTARLNVSRSNPVVAVCEDGVVTHPLDLGQAEQPGVGERPSDAQIATLLEAIPRQPHHIAGVACGPATEEKTGLQAIVWDWRDAIEAVKTAARTIGVELAVSADERAPWHPGRCAKLTLSGDANSDAVIGWAGELAPAACKAFELPTRSIAFELDADALCAGRGSAEVQVERIFTNPVAKEDIALVVDEGVTAAELEATIRAAAGEYLEDVRLFDVYTGEQVPDGKKSLAFALRLRADHTLSAEETARVRKRVIKQAEKRFNAELRA